MVIKMLTNLRRMNDHRENFSRETENIRKHQTEVMELRNMITELQSMLEGLNNRLKQAEDRAGGRSFEMIQSEKHKGREMELPQLIQEERECVKRSRTGKEGVVLVGCLGGLVG